MKDSFPTKSANPATKVAELKVGSKTQWSLFAKPHIHNTAVARVSFPVSYLLVKTKKPFTDCDMFREATAIAEQPVFNGFKHKEDNRHSCAYCFTRMVFQDATTTVGFLMLVYLRERACFYFFNDFKKQTHHNYIPIYKLAEVSTDGRVQG